MCVEQENKVSNRKMFFHNPLARCLHKNTLHTVANSKFLSKNSILMKSIPTVNLNFRAKIEVVKTLIFEQKVGFSAVCVAQHVAMLSQSQHEVQ